MRMRCISILAGLFASFALQAADTTIRWTHDGKNTDGSTATLAGFRIVYGQGNLNQSIVISDAALRAYQITGLGTGTWSFAVVAVATSGVESATSNVVQREFLPPQSPPTAPVVTQDALNVYSISKRKDGFVLLVVGTVPANTPCDPAQSVNGFNVVPRASVTWSGSVQPDVVVAKCN